MMQSKIFFTTSIDRYELTVEHDDSRYIPQFITEDGDGVIQDISSDLEWRSLPEMTQDLKIEIIAWGSDVGD